MKNQIYLLLLTITLLLAYSPRVAAQGIVFEKGTWEEIKAKAKKENKPIFIDAYTSWCGPCKKMAKTVFTQEKVGTFFNKTFLSVKMDMEKNKDGVILAKKYEVKVYPTYLFFDANGELVHRSVGAQPVEDFLITAQEATDPEKQFVVWENRYKSGIMDTSKVLLKQYIPKAMKYSNSWKEPMAKYQALLSEEEKFSRENLLFLEEIAYFTYFYNETYTDFFIKNKEKFKKNVPAEEVDGYVDEVFSSFIRYLAYVKKKYELKVRSKAEELFPEKVNELDITITYYNAKRKKQKAKVFELLSELGEKSTSSFFLNDAAWFVFEKSNDAKKIEEAIGLINRSLALQKKYYNLDTKVNLLIKAQRYQEAKEYAEELIGLGTDEPIEDYKGKSEKEMAQNLLDKINEKLKK